MKFEKKSLLEIAEKNSVKVGSKDTAEEIAQKVYNTLSKVKLNEMNKETRSFYLELNTHYKRVNRPIRVQEYNSKNPGVVETIVREILNAGEKGITKANILAVLVKKFPERKLESMKRTLNLHVPSCITKERFDVERVKDSDRYRAKEWKALSERFKPVSEIAEKVKKNIKKVEEEAQPATV